MSKVTSLHHIVFCTKHRKMSLPREHLRDVFSLIWTLVKGQHSLLLRIGGISNHIHMLVDLNPSVALSQFVREIKARSSGWLRSDGRFPQFESWAREYFAASVGIDARDAIINYINAQETHHRVTGFDEELRNLHLAIGMTYHPKDMDE